MKTMSRKYNINNLHDLNVKILSLKVDYKVKEEMLKTDTQSYLKQFTFGNLIKKFATPSNFKKADDQLNISSKIMSFVLPIVMNSTIFRGSGFITKTLVGLATNKVGKTLDADHLSSMFNTVKGLFTKKKKKIVAPSFKDYGIPPDSETY
jgi:hypothetical protein